MLEKSIFSSTTGAVSTADSTGFSSFFGMSRGFIVSRRARFEPSVAVLLTHDPQPACGCTLLLAFSDLSNDRLAPGATRGRIQRRYRPWFAHGSLFSRSRRDVAAGTADTYFMKFIQLPRGNSIAKILYCMSQNVNYLKMQKAHGTRAISRISRPEAVS